MGGISQERQAISLPSMIQRKQMSIKMMMKLWKRKQKLRKKRKRMVQMERRRRKRRKKMNLQQQEVKLGRDDLEKSCENFTVYMNSKSQLDRLNSVIVKTT